MLMINFIYLFCLIGKNSKRKAVKWTVISNFGSGKWTTLWQHVMDLTNVKESLGSIVARESYKAQLVLLLASVTVAIMHGFLY